MNSIDFFPLLFPPELWLNDNVFACPCGRGLSVVYGLSFLLVPAVVLSLAGMLHVLSESVEDTDLC